jgi:hypothetical protein
MTADWFESDVSEIVSDSILSDVAGFWETQDTYTLNAHATVLNR